MNLDPAVKTVPFGANIDIRDTVDYKEVCMYMACVGLCFGDSLWAWPGNKELSIDLDPRFT